MEGKVVRAEWGRSRNWGGVKERVFEKGYI